MTDRERKVNSKENNALHAQEFAELSLKLDALNEEAWRLRDLDREQSKKLAEEAYQLAGDTHRRPEAYAIGTGQSLTVLSFLNARANHHAEALRMAHEAEKIFYSAGYEYWLPRTYNNIALCYISMSEYERAIDSLLRQKTLSKKVGDRTMEAGAYHDLAFVYEELDQINEAKRLFEQSLVIFREVQNVVGMVLSLGHLAYINLREGVFDQAIDLASQTQAQCKELNLHEFYTDSCIAMADALVASGRPEMALIELKKGVEHTKKYSTGRPNILKHMGKWHLDHGSTLTAINYLQEALDLPQHFEYQERQLSIYELLAQSYHKQGDFERAYQYLSEFQQRQSTLFEKERKQRALNLAILHETETARRDAERAHLQNSLLEKEIAERKQVEAALRKAQAEAEAASRTKGEFLANMSHEIRTPMNGVIGMVSLLRRTKLDDEQQNFVDTIQRSGAHLLDVINEILDFSKMESGHLQLNKDAFDLHLCIQDIFSLLRHRSDENNLTFSYYLTPTVPQYVVSDAMRLRQILVNLLGNALKFTSQGSVELFVNAKQSESNLNTIHFAVQDTGIGIPQDKHAALFQPFSQADATTTRRYGGTGLGLAISKRLAEALGGEMWCDSEEHIGSTFHFSIIAEHASPSDILNLDPSEESKHRHITKANDDKKVLLVEDNLVNQKVATLMFKNLGFSVDVAQDGLEAVHAFEKNDYGIIFMDVHMPNMDGYEATRKIRQLAGSHAQPAIIAMTASVLEEDRQLALDAGMDDFLTKPVKLAELATKIEQLAHFDSPE